MRLEGQVTVLVSLVLTCIMTLVCGLVESARTAGARCYLQMASSSALDSVFAQYHRQLWEDYRLLFAEYDQPEELEADFAEFLMPYLDTENWYPMELSEVTVQEWLTAADGDGLYLENEILDYMKYGIWNLDFEADTVEEMWKTVRNGTAIGDIAGEYESCGADALQLEKSLEAISKSLETQRTLREEGLSALRRYDGSGFFRKSRALKEELRRMPGLVRAYQRQADRLAAELKEKRIKFELRMEEMQDESVKLLEEEIRSYETYVAEDGVRRKEIERLEPESAEQILRTERTEELAREAQETLDDWDDEEDSPDPATVWRPVIRHFEGLKISSLSFSHGIRDKEKEGWLQQASRLCRTRLLELVIPENAVVSEAHLPLLQAPSQSGGWSVQGRSVPLTDHLMVNEYCGQFLRSFVSEQEEDSGACAYEMEYLIAGKETDEANLSSVTARLLAVREGLNLIHILSDGQKRAEARTLAVAVTGAAAVTPLLLVTTFFIMSVWALGESVMDVRGLLAGKKVPVWKTRGDWTLTLEGLLELGKQGRAETGGGTQGMNYESWLKLLMLAENPIRQEFRLMDVIQMNIQQTQPSFQMQRGVYQVKLASRMTEKHVFLSLGLWNGVDGKPAVIYETRQENERRY